MLDPTNPYSAAKAGAEMMCKAYMTRCGAAQITWDLGAETGFLSPGSWGGGRRPCARCWPHSEHPGILQPPDA